MKKIIYILIIPHLLFLPCFGQFDIELKPGKAYTFADISKIQLTSTLPSNENLIVEYLISSPTGGDILKSSIPNLSFLHSTDLDFSKTIKTSEFVLINKAYKQVVEKNERLSPDTYTIVIKISNRQGFQLYSETYKISVPDLEKKDRKKEDLKPPALTIHGTATVIGYQIWRKGDYNEFLPPSYIQYRIDPELSILGIPFNARIQRNQSINNQSYSFLNQMNFIGFSLDKHKLKSLNSTQKINIDLPDVNIANIEQDIEQLNIEFEQWNRKFEHPDIRELELLMNKLDKIDLLLNDSLSLSKIQLDSLNLEKANIDLDYSKKDYLIKIKKKRDALNHKIDSLNIEKNKLKSKKSSKSIDKSTHKRTASFPHKLLSKTKRLDIGSCTPYWGEFSFNGTILNGIHHKLALSNVVSISYEAGLLSELFNPFFANNQEINKRRFHYGTGLEFKPSKSTRIDLYFLDFYERTIFSNLKGSNYWSGDNKIVGINFETKFIEEKFVLRGQVTGSSLRNENDFVNNVRTYDWWLMRIMNQNDNEKTYTDIAYDITLSYRLRNHTFSVNQYKIGEYFYSYSSPFILRGQKYTEYRIKGVYFNKALNASVFLRNYSELASSRDVFFSRMNGGLEIHFRKNKHPYFSIFATPNFFQSDTFVVNTYLFQMSSGYSYSIKKTRTDITTSLSIQNTNSNINDFNCVVLNYYLSKKFLFSNGYSIMPYYNYVENKFIDNFMNFHIAGLNTSYTFKGIKVEGGANILKGSDNQNRKGYFVGMGKTFNNRHTFSLRYEKSVLGSVITDIYNPMNNFIENIFQFMISTRF